MRVEIHVSGGVCINTCQSQEISPMFSLCEATSGNKRSRYSNQKKDGVNKS